MSDSPSALRLEDIQRRLPDSGPAMVHAMLASLAAEGRIVSRSGRFTTLEHALGDHDLEAIAVEIDRLLGWTNKLVHVDAIREWIGPALAIDLPTRAWAALVRRVAPSMGWVLAGRLVGTEPFAWRSFRDVVEAHAHPSVPFREVMSRVREAVLLSRATARGRSIRATVRRAKALNAKRGAGADERTG